MPSTKMVVGALATCVSLNQSKKILMNGSKMSKAKDYNICIQIPLIGADDTEMELLFLVPPPPALHLKLGLKHMLQDIF